MSSRDDRGGLPARSRKSVQRSAIAPPRSGLVAYYRFACFKKGLGVPQDEETAVEILSDGLPDLSEAAEKGDVCAQNAMGILSERGVFPLLEQDPFEARQWYARAAEGGFAKAQANFARLCAAGVGGPVDLEAAVRLYRAAGDQGDAVACYRAACLYAQGLGAERNAETVAAYVKKAARNGHAQARALVESVDGDFSPSRLMAELLIQLAEEACRRRAQEAAACEDELRYKIEIRAEFLQGDEGEGTKPRMTSGCSPRSPTARRFPRPPAARGARCRICGGRIRPSPRS